MGFVTTQRLTNPKIFVTTDNGLIIPLKSQAVSVGWQVSVDTVDVSSIGSYTRQEIPISSKTEIEIATLGDTIEALPDEGIINIALGNYSYCVRYVLESQAVSYPDHKVIETEYSLFALGALLEGDHAPKIQRVRFDLGDGTFRVEYAHEKEVDMIVERYYNQQKVNQW
jgi:hypothetical protein